jgi:hypothetical protein
VIPRLNKYHNHPRRELYPTSHITDGLEIPKFSHKVEYAPSMYVIYDSDLLQKYMDNCITWCYNNLGFRTDVKNTPAVEWTYQDHDMQRHRVFGYYHPDDNYIELRIKGHRTWVNLSNTIIHEWIHYLQPPAWYTRYYNSYTYASHPYEVLACFYSAINCNKCANFSWKKISSE